jgi:calcium-dependent protein kinase
MLYIMLCGTPPPTIDKFVNDQKEKDFRKKVFKGEISFEEEQWKDISNEAKDLIRSMLVPESQRPSA